MNAGRRNNEEPILKHYLYFTWDREGLYRFLIPLVGIPFTEGGTMNYDGYSCIIINIGVMSMGRENPWDETRR